MHSAKAAIYNLKKIWTGYPGGVRALFIAELVRAIGGSSIWPFLSIYLKESLVIAVMTVMILSTIRSLAGMISTPFVGVVLDRFGRKKSMVFCMAGMGLAYIVMAFNHNLMLWVVLMSAQGFLMSALMIAEQTVIADMVAPEERSDAYALLRIAKNIGVAIGPALGGMLIIISYTTAFLVAATFMITSAVMVYIAVPETLPKDDSFEGQLTAKSNNFGYIRVLRDYHFMAYCAVLSLIPMIYIMPMVMLPIYMKENFGLAESNFGLMMTINASMIVAFEFWTTRYARKFNTTWVIAFGSSFYALAMFIMIFAHNFEMFLLVMVIMTVGEMLVMPNAITYASNLAPSDMRGRYMGIYQLTRGAGSSSGQLLAGYLNDNISPNAVWQVAAVLGCIAVAGLTTIAVSQQKRDQKLVAQINGD
jgi:MFS family permease